MRDSSEQRPLSVSPGVPSRQARADQLQVRMAPPPPPRMWLNKVLPQFSSKKRIPDAESGPCSAENNRGGIRSHAVLILAPEFFFKASSSSPRVVSCSCSCRHLHEAEADL